MKQRLQFDISAPDLPPDGVVLEDTVPIAVLDIPEDDRIACPQPLSYRLHFSPLQSGEILVQGTLGTTLRCRCDRCLRYFDAILSTSDCCHIVRSEENVVDLTDDAREDILMAFPVRCMCRDDCRGLCPQCGQNLNVRECACAEQDRGESAWSALDRLRLPKDPG